MKRLCFSTLGRTIPYVFPLLLSGCASGRQPARPAPEAEPALDRIAFGSCNDQNDPQPLWAPIRLTFQVRDRDNRVRLEERVALSALRPTGIAHR